MFSLTDFLAQDLFEFQGRSFTVGDVAKVSAGVIILIIVGVVVCLAVSWWKRRAIAKAAVATRDSIVRFSQRMSSKMRSGS